MSAKQRAAEQARYDIPDPEPMDTYEDEVLTGATRIDISAGGEATLGAGEGSLGADATEMYEELAANHK
jgi:hypothetical protein